MDTDLIQMTVRIPWGLIRRAKVKAVNENRTLRDLVMEALEIYLRSRR
jgi:hypothetical protein